MIRKLLAFAFLLTGLAAFALTAPGVWQDYLIDPDNLVEAPAYDPPDGACSQSMGFLTTCGFAVTHSKTFEVTLFDYIHLESGAWRDIPALPMLTADGVLTFSYGIETLGQRIQFLLVAFGLTVLGGLLLLSTRRG